jgi:hypothetical protein
LVAKSITIGRVTDCILERAKLIARIPGISAEEYARPTKLILGSKNPKTIVKSRGCNVVRKRK